MAKMSASERETKMDNLLEAASETYQNSAVIEALGQEKATLLGKLISQATIVKVVDGIAELPEDTDIDNIVPIIALHGGEEVTLGRSLRSQTATQRTIAIQTIESWKPLSGTPSAASYVSQNSSALESYEGSKFGMPVRNGGFVSSALTSFLVNKTNFNDSPDGFALFKTIPLLGITIDHEIKPDTLGHELTHWQQMQEDPVPVFDSQETIDMAMLRMELEAYHCGATIRKGMNGGLMPRLP